MPHTGRLFGAAELRRAIRGVDVGDHDINRHDFLRGGLKIHSEDDFYLKTPKLINE
jgi:hypothetical protein